MASRLKDTLHTLLGIAFVIAIGVAAVLLYDYVVGNRRVMEAGVRGAVAGSIAIAVAFVWLMARAALRGSRRLWRRTPRPPSRLNK